MRKITRSIIAVAALSVLSVQPIAAVAEAGYGGTLTVDAAFVCNGPSSGTYGTKGSLRIGTKVFYSRKISIGTAPDGTRTRYVEVTAENGRKGYVYVGFIKRNTAVADSSKLYVSTGNNVKLHAKASLDSAAVGKVSRNQRFILRRKGKEFSLIELLDGTDGYIANQYLQEA